MVSLAAVLSLGFLLLVSLLLTALAVGGKYFAPYHLPETAMHAVGSAVSFGMITLLFAMMFKWLPDTHVAWRDAIDKSLKRRPYTTLALTLALGFLLGVMWAR
jgi:membrane protein